MNRYEVLLYCRDQRGNPVIQPVYTGKSQKRWTHRYQHFSMLYQKHERYHSPFWWAKNRRAVAVRVLGIEKRWYTRDGSPVLQRAIGVVPMEVYDVQRV